MNVSHARQVVEDTRAGSSDAALFALVDVTRRRLAAIEQHKVPSAGDRFAQNLIEGVYAVILVVTMGAWAILGFVVWVPLLVRNTIFLTGSVFYASLLRDQVIVADAKDAVVFAARFYARGFEHFRAFYRQRYEPEAPVGLFQPLTTMTRGDFLVEGLWVGTVWVGAAFALNAAVSLLLGA